MRALIAGNWKMNGLAEDAKALAAGLKSLSGEAELPADLLVCPPFPYLGLVAQELAGSRITLGGQDCHGANSGAHTGDTAAPMLRDVGCSYVILGHSERRADHGETDALVRGKAEAALAAGLVPIVCVGETEQERNAGQALSVIARQVKGSVPAGMEAERLVVAYEPVWAIGTGRTATAADVVEVHAEIRRLLVGLVGEGAQSVRILYGGSVKPDNAAELLSQANVDGALVGGASLKAEDFWAIAQSA
ncbi:triose-phosphate isomerase [Pelagibius marinus]|uniref:triose-phosphate isomerase n=1 Tax=Pelagibius marinus TaxID=2762760 RepID=UPI0018728400|nr:triose-phosphate isomerase [Pelagibius marinus]